jgi:hypothetical protein
LRLVDTSAWIEWLIDSETGKAIEAAVPQQGEIARADGCAA